MRRLFALALLGASVACGAPEPPVATALLGTWRSDKAATLAEIDVIGGFSPKVRRVLGETLGRRTLTYTATRVTARVEGGARTTTSSPYRVVSSRGNRFELEGYDVVLGEPGRTSLVVEGDRMWLWMDGGRWREFYRRVP